MYLFWSAALSRPRDGPNANLEDSLVYVDSMLTDSFTIESRHLAVRARTFLRVVDSRDARLLVLLGFFPWLSISGFFLLENEK